MTELAVVLLSGGLDSGTALAMWRAAGNDVAACVFADYGQRAVEPERAAASRLAAKFGAPLREVALPWLATAAGEAGSSLVDPRAELPQRTVADPGDDASAQAVWVPARNVVLVAAAAAVAESLGAGWVVAGFNREEAATFEDNSPDFVSAFDAVLGLGTRHAVRLTSPTIGLDKTGIAAEARRSGLGPESFWSCYEGGDQPCESCESCVRAKRAWGALDSTRELEGGDS